MFWALGAVVSQDRCCAVLKEVPSQGEWQIEITRGSSVQREAPSGVL